MCLMCEEEAFFQAYQAYIARKQTGAAGEAPAFKAEAVEDSGTENTASPNESAGDKVQSS